MEKPPITPEAKDRASTRSTPAGSWGSRKKASNSKKKAGSSSKKREKPAPVLDIPYFAHMTLNPDRYPGDVGLPRQGLHSQERGSGGVQENFSEDSDDEKPPGGSFTTPKKRSDTTSTFSGSSYKKLKVDGGRPALAKKVTADLDSDDQIIVNMKAARYQEGEIAQRLKDEGRIAYNPKTIGTRWARLKKALALRQDELLEQDLTDWHDGDDDVLQQAIQNADDIIAKQKQDVEERKWRLVAENMKQLKPVVNFSHNACRNRYQALQDGTAKPTPESIDQPDELTQARIQSRVDKERDIETMSQDSFQQSNIEMNGWTSKSGTFQRSL